MLKQGSTVIGYRLHLKLSAAESCKKEAIIIIQILLDRAQCTNRQDKLTKELPIIGIQCVSDAHCFFLICHQIYIYATSEMCLS